VFQEIEGTGLIPEEMAWASGFPARFVEVRQGRRYLIRASDPTGGARQVVRKLRLLNRPANDDQENAQPIALPAGPIAGNNFLATAQDGEWNLSRSVWYSFNPTHDGVWGYELVHPGHLFPGFYPRMNLQRRNPTGDWQGIEYLQVHTRGRFAVDAGSFYRLVIDGSVSTPFEDFLLNLDPETGVANDRLEQAAALEGAPALLAGNLELATRNSEEKSPGIWWKWRAPRSGLATLGFEGAAPEARVFRREVSGLLTLSHEPRFDPPYSQDLALHEGRIATTFPCVAGEEYLILARTHYRLQTWMIKGWVDVTSARVVVGGVQDPMDVRLEGFDPDTEGEVSKVLYQSGPYWGPSVETEFPFEASLAAFSHNAFTLKALMDRTNGNFCVAILRLPPRNDEMENALVLDPWNPLISGSGDDSSFGSGDTFAMRSVFSNRGGGTLWYRWKSPSREPSIFKVAVASIRFFCEPLATATG